VTNLSPSVLSTPQPVERHRLIMDGPKVGSARITFDPEGRILFQTIERIFGYQEIEYLPQITHTQRSGSIHLKVSITVSFVNQAPSSMRNCCAPHTKTPQYFSCHALDKIPSTDEQEYYLRHLWKFQTRGYLGQSMERSQFYESGHEYFLCIHPITHHVIHDNREEAGVLNIKLSFLYFRFIHTYAWH
jgi:hypothetical protein